MGIQFDRPANPRPIRIGERDIEIIAQVHKHRLVNADGICRAVSHMTFRDEDAAGSDNHTRRRLQALWAAGFLARPRAQTLVMGKQENKSLVYGLDQKGAELLVTERNLDLKPSRWSEKNARARYSFISHSVDIADVLTRFEAAAREQPGLSYIDSQVLLSEAPHATQQRRNPWRFQGETGLGGSSRTIACYPDGVFALEEASDDSRTRMYFTLEVDKAGGGRNSMPVIRGKGLESAYWAAREAVARTKSEHNAERLRGEIENARVKLLKANCTDRQRSYIQKILSYYSGWRSRPQWHQEQFGFPSYRVLTVTGSEERIATMSKAVEIVTGSRSTGMFLFATRDAIQASDNIFDVTWRTAAGKGVKFLV